MDALTDVLGFDKVTSIEVLVNMQLALGFAAILLSILSYFILSLTFGVYQRYPIPHFLLMLLGLAWMVRFTIRDVRPQKIFSLVGGIVLAGLFGFYTLIYSSYDQPFDVQIGATLPEPLTEISLRNQDGTSIRLSDLLSEHQATLLVFYRGFWCPYCIGELDRLVDKRDLFENMGVGLLPLTVDTPDQLKGTHRKFTKPVDLFSDSDGILMDHFDIRHEGGAAGKDIPRPAKILVNSTGEILWFRISDNYRTRAQPSEIIEAVSTALR